MKNLIIKNKLKRPDIVDAAVIMFNRQLNDTGYKASNDFKNSYRNYTQKMQIGTAVGNAMAVEPAEIMADAVGGYKLAILIYGEPAGTNPMQYPYNINGMTCISIPESWYINAQDPVTVLFMYLLHEASHAGFMFKDFYLSDMTHLPSNRDMAPMEYDRLKLGQGESYQIAYYTSLLAGLIPYLETAVIPVPSAKRTLKKGMSGDDVSDLQRKLKSLGYFKYPFITKTFGSATEQAVKDYQKANCMMIDGIVGPKTLAKLYGTSS